MTGSRHTIDIHMGLKDEAWTKGEIGHPCTAYIVLKGIVEVSTR